MRFRKISHIFKSGVLSLGMEHFFAMFPATVLVPLMINNHFGRNVIVDVNLVLLTSGIGTLLFLILSQGEIPAYVGSSFAYIGVTIYLMTNFQNDGNAIETAYTYVGWAYVFAGIILIFLSLICKFKNISQILTFLLPAPIIGPAISLIGLELASTALIDSGFVASGSFQLSNAVISLTTLVIIVLFSVTRHKYLKNAAIIVGVVIGCVISMLITKEPIIHLKGIDIFHVPKIACPFLHLPRNSLNLFIAIIPSTLIIFMENMGRLTIIDRMINERTEEQPIFNKNVITSFKTSLFSHGIATTVAAMLGSVPNTLYTENIAVMEIHAMNRTYIKKDNEEKFIINLYEPYSCAPYIVAAFIAIIVSLIGILHETLLNIPKPVIGGVELFLFGIISAPGIQLLVEQRVDYKKISNQILTASVLISGISGLQINLGIVELEGMSLGFTVGVILNLLFNFLRWMGRLNDNISFEEVFQKCVSAAKGDYKVELIQRTASEEQPASTEETLQECVDTAKGDCKEKLIQRTASEEQPASTEGTLQECVDTAKGDRKEKLIQRTPSEKQPVYTEELISNCLTTDDFAKIFDGKGDSEKLQLITIDYILAIIKNCSEVAITYEGNKKLLILTKTTNNLLLKINTEFLDGRTVTSMLNDYKDYCDIGDKFLELKLNGQIPERIFLDLVRVASQKK